MSDRAWWDIFYSAVFVALGLDWYRTGQSTFLRASLFLAHVEASRRQLIRSLRAGLAHLRGNYRTTANEVLQEVAGSE